MKKINLNFGMKNGKLIDISQVPKGLECGCVCPSCGSKLVARKGEKRKHHFSHYQTRECEGYLETTLHLAAKEILLKNREIVFPMYDIEDGRYTNKKSFKYRNVVSEEKIEDIIPDIKLNFGNGNQVFVEIKVTHEVDDIKLEKLKRIGVSTLEIDLSTLEFEGDVLELNELEKIILQDTNFKRWVFDKNYKKNKSKHEEYLEDLEKKEIEKKESYRRYRFENQYKDNKIGVLWLKDHEDLSGYILYENKEFRVFFEKKYSTKKNSPTYIMNYEDKDGDWVEEYGKGAIWEKENNKLSGNICIDSKKYIVSLIPEELQNTKRPNFYVKLIKKENKT